MPPEFNFSSIPFSVKFIIVSSPEVQTFEMYMLESALKSAGHLWIIWAFVSVNFAQKDYKLRKTSFKYG